MFPTCCGINVEGNAKENAQEYARNIGDRCVRKL